LVSDLRFLQIKSDQISHIEARRNGNSEEEEAARIAEDEEGRIAEEDADLCVI
jgi:hypothetical protein